MITELSNQEMQSINGGTIWAKILGIRGLGDGIKGNTEIFLFGQRIYHGDRADDHPQAVY